MSAWKSQLLMTVVSKQFEQFALQSLPSSQESGCTHHCLCLTKLNLGKASHPQNLHHFVEYPDSKRFHGALQGVARPGCLGLNSGAGEGIS